MNLHETNPCRVSVQTRGRTIGLQLATTLPRDGRRSGMDDEPLSSPTLGSAAAGLDLPTPPFNDAFELLRLPVADGELCVFQADSRTWFALDGAGLNAIVEGRCPAADLVSLLGSLPSAASFMGGGA